MAPSRANVFEIARPIPSVAPVTIAALPASRPPVEEVLAVAERLASWSIHVHARLVSPALVDAARKAGRPVLAYTVNEVADARALFAAGVSGVFTDHPARMLRALEAAC